MSWVSHSPDNPRLAHQAWAIQATDASYLEIRRVTGLYKGRGCSAFRVQDRGQTRWRDTLSSRPSMYRALRSWVLPAVIE